MMEEWAGVTNAEERRRIQNRLAQRKRSTSDRFVVSYVDSIANPYSRREAEEP